MASFAIPGQRVNTRNVKLLVFAIGASLGGLAAAMSGALQRYVSESFTLPESFAVLSCVVLGGMRDIPVVILGAALLAALPECLRSTMGPLQDLLFGHEIIATEANPATRVCTCAPVDHAVRP